MTKKEPHSGLRCLTTCGQSHVPDIGLNMSICPQVFLTTWVVAEEVANPHKFITECTTWQW